MSKSSEAEKLAQAWLEGHLCLHPSDTLPGLSFNPWRAEAAHKLFKFKGRPESKKPLALIASWELALRLWKALPEPWPRLLPSLWPGPLSVIWDASPICPSGILAEDGTVGLRWPLFPSELAWMKEALELIDEPFPSTSVNRSGKASLSSWPEAVSWIACEDSAVYIPQYAAPFALAASSRSLPSTLIKIEQNGSFSVLRTGAMDPSYIQSSFQGAVNDRNF